MFFRKQDRAAQRRRQEFRIYRKPLAQFESLCFGAQPELLQMRPGFFGIDEVRRQWRNSSPVVDAGVQQIFIIRSGQIWRRLNIHVRHTIGLPRRCATFHLGWVRASFHRNARLGAEILHDDFLNVSVALV